MASREAKRLLARPWLERELRPDSIDDADLA